MLVSMWVIPSQPFEVVISMVPKVDICFAWINSSTKTWICCFLFSGWFCNVVHWFWESSRRSNNLRRLELRPILLLSWHKFAETKLELGEVISNFDVASAMNFGCSIIPYSMGLFWRYSNVSGCVCSRLGMFNHDNIMIFYIKQKN